MPYKLVAVPFSVVLFITVVKTGQASEAVYQKVIKSAVLVLAEEGQESSAGSGALVDFDRKLVVTNYHVVTDKQDIQVIFPTYEADSLITERTEYVANLKEVSIPGRVFATDRRRDLALIQLDRLPSGAESIAIAATEIGPGGRVHGIGNPSASDAMWVYNSGTVRAVYQRRANVEGQFVEFRVIETTTPINPGDSGGPVVNDQGELVGVAASHRTDARLVSHTIHASEVQSLLNGENKTVDSSIAAALDSASFKYTVNENGLFEVTLPNDDGTSQIVFVESTTRVILNFAVRHIFSPAVVSNQPFPDAVASILLKDNSSVNVGAWEIREADDRFFAVFAAKIGTTASSSDLKTVIRSVAVKSRDLVKAIDKVPAGNRAGVSPVLAGGKGGSDTPAEQPSPRGVALAPPANDPVPAPTSEVEEPQPTPQAGGERQAEPPAGPSNVVGRWMAVTKDEQYGEVGVGLGLSADGRIQIVIAKADCVLEHHHGQYTFDGVKLSWQVGDKLRQATVKFSANGFVLHNSDLTLKFVALPEDHAAPAPSSRHHCRPGFAARYCR